MIKVLGEIKIWNNQQLGADIRPLDLLYIAFVVAGLTIENG